MLGRLRICSLVALMGALTSMPSACKSKEEKAAPKNTSVAVGPKDGGQATPDVVPVKVEPTWYLVTLHSDEHKADVPFYLGVPARASGQKAVLLQGTESTELPIVWSDATHFEVKFELFQSSIRATIDEAGTLSGQWEQKSGSWGEAELSMSARPADGPHNEKLFVLDQGATLAPNEGSGVWKLSLNDSGNVKLELDTKDGAAHGMLYFASGNIIALAGQSANGKLRLGGFDGTSAYLFEADYADDKTLKNGTWLAGATLSWQETFRGERNEQFDLKTGPQMTNPEKGITVAGINLDAFKGKPTIIEMAGSWCITCRFAAPYLRQIYTEFHPKGLEMVTLAYEFTDDAAYNKQRAQDFKKEYELPWEVIPVTGGPDEFDAIMPKGLDDVDVSGFPISIFVGRDGVVKHVHAGFPGSKDSEVYETVTKEYREKVEELVAP